jgi:hypothetical protein
VNHTKVLQQAWHMVWRYRVLWVFGIILALTTASWPAAAWIDRDDDGDRGGLVYVGPNGSVIDIGGYDGDRRGDGGDLVLNYKHQADGRPYHKGDVVISYDPPDDLSLGVVAMERGHLELKTLDVRPGVVRRLIPLGIGLACAAAILFVASRIAHYVAETALIRMASDYSETGKRHSMWQGFRIGWSRSAWRLFLTDLAIDVPVALALTPLFLVALAPLLLWTVGSTVAGVIGTLATISLFLLAVLTGVAAGVIVPLLKRFFRRACALEGLSAGKAIRQGYTIIKDNLLDIGLTWLITVGVRIGLAVLMVPVVLILVTVSATLSGTLALVVGGLTGLAFEGATPWVLGAVVGIPAFLLVLAAPLAFVGGLLEVFLSSTWTLTYRQLRGLKSLTQEPQPELDTRSLRPAPAAQ